VVDLTWSVDDVARTSDDAAVRAQFDARTLVWLRLLSLAYLVEAVPHFIAAVAKGWVGRTIVAGALFLVSLLLFLAVRKRPRVPTIATFVRKRVRGVAIGVAIFELTLLLLYHARDEGSIAFAMLMPMVVLGYRLLPAEHVLLHAAMAGVSITTFVLFPYPKDPMAPAIAAAVMVNAMFLTAALLISRRARRNIIADWTERRASAREQIRMRDELRYARELQLSMLPECAPSLEWADLCAISIPASEVGGDYYDYFVDDERVAIVCGDVAGHGMAAGLVLSALRTGFTLMRDALHDPAAVLRRLHDLVAQTSRRRMLVTVTVLLLDRKNMRATIASAGHPPVILFRPDQGGNVEMIDLFAPPLGVRLPVQIPQRTMAVKPGDVFVLHSDGIYETRNNADAVYGLERLLTIVHEHGYGTAEELRNAIVAHVERFRGEAMQGDDVTVVVAKVM
jgi:serine phosphatase RsbU (regulator of sigma subunit)